MKILQIFDQTSPFVSGYSMRSKYLTDAIKRLGVDIDVISSPIFNYPKETEQINSVRYIRSKIDKWDLIRKFPLFKEGMIVKSIQKTIEENWDSNIEVIDAHSSVLNGIAGSKIAKKKNKPFVYEIRAFWEDAAVDQGKTKEGSLRYNLTRAIESKIIDLADKITVICQGLKNDLIERGVKDHKIAVIPNGVDIDQFKLIDQDEELQDRYELKNNIVFGFIGTFFKFEGLELLVRAAKQVVIKHKNVKFLLVGSGHEEENLKCLVKEMGLSKHIIFTGRVSHDEVKRYYSIVDIFVYPRISRRITELVTPLKPLEAMAFEKGVIASDVGGLKELVKDQYNGLLFKAQDVTDLAHKCMYAIENKDKIDQLSKMGREYVEKQRNWNEITKNYLGIFKELGVTL